MTRNQCSFWWPWMFPFLGLDLYELFSGSLLGERTSHHQRADHSWTPRIIRVESLTSTSRQVFFIPEFVLPSQLVRSGFRPSTQTTVQCGKDLRVLSNICRNATQISDNVDPLFINPSLFIRGCQPGLGQESFGGPPPPHE